MRLDRLWHAFNFDAQTQTLGRQFESLYGVRPTHAQMRAIEAAAKKMGLHSTLGATCMSEQQLEQLTLLTLHQAKAWDDGTTLSASFWKHSGYVSEDLKTRQFAVLDTLSKPRKTTFKTFVDSLWQKQSIIMRGLLRSFSKDLGRSDIELSAFRRSFEDLAAKRKYLTDPDTLLLPDIIEKDDTEYRGHRYLKDSHGNTVHLQFLSTHKTKSGRHVRFGFVDKPIDSGDFVIKQNIMMVDDEVSRIINSIEPSILEDIAWAFSVGTHDNTGHNVFDEVNRWRGNAAYTEANRAQRIYKDGFRTDDGGVNTNGYEILVGRSNKVAYDEMLGFDEPAVTGLKSGSSKTLLHESYYQKSKEYLSKVRRARDVYQHRYRGLSKAARRGRLKPQELEEFLIEVFFTKALDLIYSYDNYPDLDRLLHAKNGKARPYTRERRAYPAELANGKNHYGESIGKSWMRARLYHGPMAEVSHWKLWMPLPWRNAIENFLIARVKSDLSWDDSQTIYSPYYVNKDLEELRHHLAEHIDDPELKALINELPIADFSLDENFETLKEALSPIQSPYEMGVKGASLIGRITKWARGSNDSESLLAMQRSIENLDNDKLMLIACAIPNMLLNFEKNLKRAGQSRLLDELKNRLDTGKISQAELFEFAHQHGKNAPTLIFDGSLFTKKDPYQDEDRAMFMANYLMFYWNKTETKSLAETNDPCVDPVTFDESRFYSRYYLDEIFARKVWETQFDEIQIEFFVKSLKGLGVIRR